MSHALGPKALDCLVLAADHPALTFEEWRLRYDELCERYSAKAVDSMYESLCDRGYTEYGVTARMGWPTDKGMAALAAVQTPQ